MKKLLAVMVMGLMVVMGLVKADDSVEPSSLSFTNSRSDTVTYVSQQEFYRGSSLLLTNCVLYTTNGVVQGLAGVTVELKWGSTASNHTYTATVQDAAEGKWCLPNFTVPTNWEAPFIQIKITDSMTNSFIYPWGIVRTKAAL